eukprot:TRINITY_DN4425_c0_g1_i1.p1 TRINITY_DN4425_c0_g1~~TRINITY_DN4425_c0_g1_i1.p1  ORF type:complete len:324 (+),score=130.52 TRINITY_DN4425_c0_g1_i1:55-1026(+)
MAKSARRSVSPPSDAPRNAAPRTKQPRASRRMAFFRGLMFLAGLSAILFALDDPEDSVDPTEVVTRISTVTAVLLVAHFVWLRFTRSPYYIAHAIVNFLIVFITAPALWMFVTDTVEALKVRTVDTWAMDLCNGLHVYHVMAYTDLRFVDYLHHVVMVFFCMPLCYVAELGLVANYNMFFVSGLPGGVDYVMLALVRYKLLRKLTEKKWNTSINVWVRSPFLVGSVFLSHTQVMLVWDSLTRQNVICHFVCQAIQLWNAMYFTESVVGDYYRQSVGHDGTNRTIALYHDLSDDEDSEDGTGGVAVLENFVYGPQGAKHDEKES